MRGSGQARFFLGVMVVSVGSAAFSLALRAALSFVAHAVAGGSDIVLPLAIATAVAAFVAKTMHPDSIYTAELRQRGVLWDVSLEGGRTVRRDEPAS